MQFFFVQGRLPFSERFWYRRRYRIFEVGIGMPRQVKPLSELKIRQAKFQGKDVSLFDGDGLYLLVQRTGKHWRFKYRYQGRARLMSLGSYPEVSLLEAREKRQEYRKLLAQGVDPITYLRKRDEEERLKNTRTFRALAEEWFEMELKHKAPSYSSKVQGRLVREVFPVIGDKPLDEVTPQDLLTIIQRFQAMGKLETARRIIQHVGQVYRYGIITQRCRWNLADALKGVLPQGKVKHMAAPTDDPKLVGELLRMFDSYSASPVVRGALRLLPLVFVRPGELRHMRWEQIDWEAGEWRFTMSKVNQEHIVYLSTQALAILKELKLITGSLPGGWVFPGGRDLRRPISDAAINAAYQRMGIDTKNVITGHGWRAVARTFLAERLGYPPDVIELQLGHRVPDRLGRAYNRARFAEQRRRMMQDWADYLEQLKGVSNKNEVHLCTSL
jgi:integrase